MPTPKYEREIRSLLDKLPNFLPDTSPSAPSAPRRQPSPPRASVPSPPRSWLLRDAYAMVALLVVLARFGQPVLGSAGAHLLGWVAVVVLVLALSSSIVRFFVRPTPPDIWRGNVITYHPRSGAPAFPFWLRRWLNGRGPRRR